MDILYKGYWSIYILSKNVDKVRRIHLPAVEELIGKQVSGWDVFKEEYNDNPNEVRMCSSFELNGISKDEMALKAIKLVNLLAPGAWNISGLSSLNSEMPFYFFGLYSTEKPSSKAPAVTNALLEIQQADDDFSNPHPTQLIPPPVIS